MSSDIEKATSLRRAGLILCVLLIALGIAVLIGWFFNITVLKSIYPGLVTFRINTAVEVILCAVTLAILFQDKQSKLRRYGTTILSLCVIFIACLTLSEDLFNWSLGIDQLLFKDAYIGEKGFAPVGRMPLSSAYCSLLLGIALLVGSQSFLPRSRLPIMAALSITVLMISGLVTFSYIIDFFLQSTWIVAEMSIHSAIAFVLLAITVQLLVLSEFELKWHLDKLTTGMFVAGIVALLCIAARSNHLTDIFSQDRQWVTHSRECLEEINKIWNDLAILENAQNGYIITGDEKLLENSIQMKAKLKSSVAILYKLTVDNVPQQHRIENLRSLLLKKIEMGDKMVQAGKQQKFSKAPQVLANPEEIIVTDNMYKSLAEIQQEELKLLAHRVQHARFSIEHTLLMLPIQVFLSLTILSFAIFWLNVGVASRKTIEDQLRQSQKMEAIGQLTGGVAHDFNNLLGVILGNLDLLERLVAGNELAMKRVKIIQTAAVRGSDLTKRLLTFSRLSQLTPVPVALEKSIKNVIDMASRTLGPELKIITKFEESLPPVLVDGSELESALLNLIVNARDAMPDGGTITISTQFQEIYADDAILKTKDLKPGRYAHITVADNGHGMSNETLAKAFEPFFTTKMRGKGSGLGLSMVYGFVKQSGGFIKIYSEVGHGTAVSIYLPLAAEEELPLNTTARSPMQIKTGGTVLIVDDETDLLEVAVLFLEDMGYQVLHASDGQSALAILEREEKIDLLITDIIMPGGLNGVDLGMKARKINPKIKVIYTSGFPSSALAERSKTKIDGPLLNKPYQRKDLVEAIRIAMSGKPNE